MNYPKFTRGPWSIRGYAGEHDEAGASIVSAEGESIAHTAYLENNTRKRWAEYYANAALIVTAPKLYDKLQELLTMGADDGIASWALVWDEVEELLAEARKVH